MPPLRIFLLGAPQVHLGDRPVSFSTRKTQALLIYLAVETGLQPREHLAALLWPEADPKRSHANLRNTLNHLQKGLRQASEQAQTDYLHVTHHSLGLNHHASIDFDLHIIEQAYALARADRVSRTLPEGSVGLPILQSAVSFQRGDFLVGFSLGDAPGFDDWVAIQREVWRRRMGLILDRLSEIQFVRGEFAGAAETASRWIALDTVNEVAYRRKMRAHFAAGERGQALDTYETCQMMLAAELGGVPEPDTTTLAEHIRTQVSPLHARADPTAPRLHRQDTSVVFLEKLFAGRVREILELQKCYTRAAAGQTQIVVLRGEAGIGKTRLAKEFFVWAAAQKAELLHGSAFESGRHWPFQPLIEALRLRFEGENSPNVILDNMWSASLSQLLPDLRQHYLDLSPVLEGRFTEQDHLDLQADISETQFFEPFTRFTMALAEQAPLMLWVDDLQWTDSATLDLLQYAIRRWRESAGENGNAARILLLVSLRSEALHPMTQPQQAASSTGVPRGLGQWLASVEREITPVHLELAPLGEHETVQMVQSILAPPAAEFAQWLYVETRGQPFYLMETLKDLLERRVLHPKRRGAGQWIFVVDRDHELGQAVRVPSTVHAVIRSRLNRLSPNAFALLAAGAVLEQQITFERLCAISNVAEDLALPALDELISSRLLLEAAQPGAASDYSFANDMVREVVYTEAGDARRRLFHRRALENIEAGGAPPAVLVYHAQAAGQTQAAFHHSLAAGREALGLSATSEAIVHLERALQIIQMGAMTEIPDKTVLRALYLWLSQTYERVGQTEKASAIDAERSRMGF